MFTFMLGAIGGAVAGGSYVLLRTPRTGKENRRFMKNFIQTTKANVENVQDEAKNVEEATQNLNTEINKLQLGFIPDVMNTVNDFKTEADVYSRRINDGINIITNEVDSLNNRIQTKTDLMDNTEDPNSNSN